MNKLYRKIAVFDGDSISAGSIREGQFPWAHFIGGKHEMAWKNYSVGGGTVTAGVYRADGAERYSISKNIDRIKAEFDTVDYLVFDGGTNDADLLIDEPSRFGKFDENDFSGAYDDKTFTGAMETLFYKALKYYPKAKICYIVAQKMREMKEENGVRYFNERRRYFLRAIELCKKWGIPYLDLWETCPLDPYLSDHYDPDITPEENEKRRYLYKDGQHLTSHGYAIINPMIEGFIEKL